jgi:radical SAM superfamily enzyme YgiQ (UPF0313 family)
VEVIDFWRNWSVEERQALLKSRITKNTKFIGLSFFYVIWDDKLESFCSDFKKDYPDIPIILGSSARFDIKSASVDYNISGFGENGLLELLKYLFSNGPRPSFTLSTNMGKHIDANSFYPAYPLKSLMVRYEDRDFLDPGEWLSVELARGCKFSCAFCNFPVLGVKGDYSRDGEDFRLQLQETYDKYGITHYSISDETVNDRTEKITKFANEVEKLSFTPFFTGFIRADLAISRPLDREELLRMNFLGQYYGIESFNYTTAKTIGKGMHPDRVKSGLLELRNYYENNGSKRYRGSISFIAGLPDETKDTLEDTVSWLKTNWQGHSFTMTPLMIQVGRGAYPSKISDNYQEYGYRSLGRNPNTPFEMYWENDQMNYYEAVKFTKHLQTLYQDPNLDFRLSCWAIATMGSIGDFDQLLRLKKSQERILFDLSQKLFDDYKRKKLSL